MFFPGDRVRVICPVISYECGHPTELRYLQPGDEVELAEALPCRFGVPQSLAIQFYWVRNRPAGDRLNWIPESCIEPAGYVPGSVLDQILGVGDVPAG